MTFEARAGGATPRPFAFSAMPVGLPQHPDEHRPKDPVLLAVDQELGEHSPVTADETPGLHLPAVCVDDCRTLAERSRCATPA